MSLVKTNQLTNLDNDGQVEVLEGLQINTSKTLSVLGPLADKDGDLGEPGQVLLSTSTGVNWGNPTDLNNNYFLSLLDGTTSNSVTLRLSDNNAVPDDINFLGDSNFNLSRTGDTLNIGLVQDISTTSNVTFNSVTSSGSLITSDSLERSNTNAKITWDSTQSRWQFTNDGVVFYNFITPSETLYDVANQYGSSGDATQYEVLGTQFINENSQTYLRVQLNSVSSFNTLQQVKIFGATTTPVNELPVAPTGSTVQGISEEALFNNVNIPKSFYVYIFASFRLDTGDISDYNQYNTVVENLSSNQMNEGNYNLLNITRNAGNGLLVYRAEFDTANEANIAINSSNKPQFKLVHVLGPKEFDNGLTVSFKDYCEYDISPWSRKNADGSYKDDTVHFPLTPPASPKRGWTLASLREVNRTANTITLDVPGLIQDTSGYTIYLYHDDTRALQNAIDAVYADGTKFLIVPGGTYLIDQIKLPTTFTLRGLDDSTVFTKQYWSTGNLSSSQLSGLQNAMFIGENYDATQPQETWGLKNFSLRDMLIDGNSENQILYPSSDLGVESNNALLAFPNSEFVRLQNVKVRNGYGPAIYAEGSLNFSIFGSYFIDGMDTERYETPCVLMSSTENTTINNTTFQNYPGEIDLTTGKVISMTGCVVRNCGTGIRIYGSVNTDVIDNIVLGPADEFIPVPDLYDSDYDGVNISVTPGIETQTPVYQYQQNGESKDLTNTVVNFEIYNATVSNGVETVDFNNQLTAVKFQEFNPLDANLNPLDDKTLGQIRFKLPIDQTNNIPTTTPSNYLVYRIVGIDYITLGSDINNVVGTGIASGNNPNTYDVNITNEAVYNSLAVGDYIKLVSHDYSPNPSTEVWRIESKVASPEFKISLIPYIELSDGTLNPGSGLISVSANPLQPTIGGGYLQVRQNFVIAKGVVSVVQ